jgi:hypothetical protein
MVAETWDALPDRFPDIDLDAFVAMSNYEHGIIAIASGCADANRAPL